jgi:RimJ/RimL family protein N-acetyltransferase
VTDLPSADDRIALRAFQADDLPFLDRLGTDPAVLGPFLWPGFTDARARRRRWELDGYLGAETSMLAAVLPDGTVAGLVSWRVHNRGGSPGVCYEIGMALLPEHRGRGLGTAGHRLLVDYLFSYTTVYRLEAMTNVHNLAEQKVLERLGFQREGVLRAIVFSHGAWQDNAVYSLLRPEAGPEAGREAGREAGHDAGPEAGRDAGPEARREAGPEAGGVGSR